MPMKNAPGPAGVLTEMLVAAGKYGLEELIRLTNIPTCQFKVYSKPLEQVNSFVYLGIVFISDGRCEKEVRRRI